MALLANSEPSNGTKIFLYIPHLPQKNIIGMTEEYNNGGSGLSLLITHYSSIPTCHYPGIPIYINFALPRQQKRGDHG
jgi:hypothetical protein